MTVNTLVIEGTEIADIHFGCVRILCERGSLLDDEQAEIFTRWLMEQTGLDGRLANKKFLRPRVYRSRLDMS